MQVFVQQFHPIQVGPILSRDIKFPLRTRNGYAIEAVFRQSSLSVQVCEIDDFDHVAISRIDCNDDVLIPNIGQHEPSLLEIFKLVEVIQRPIPDHPVVASFFNRGIRTSMRRFSLRVSRSQKKRNSDPSLTMNSFDLALYVIPQPSPFEVS